MLNKFLFKLKIRILDYFFKNFAHALLKYAIENKISASAPITYSDLYRASIQYPYRK